MNNLNDLNSIVGEVELLMKEVEHMASTLVMTLGKAGLLDVVEDNLQDLPHYPIQI